MDAPQGVGNRASQELTIDVVIPTVGRASLGPLLARLLEEPASATGRVFVVDDRRQPAEPLAVPSGVVVVRSGGRGPAAARNAGWRAADGAWIAFLDDDVLPDRGWSAALRRDLEHCYPTATEPGHTKVSGAVAGDEAPWAVSQGRVRVPLPEVPNDAQRNVGRLDGAAWITADLAIPRRILALSGGFDERFRRAYREDTDLALRLTAAGVTHHWGERRAAHPPAPSPWWVSIPQQRGNADDALLRRLHGPRWRDRAQVPSGRFKRHAAITAAAALTVTAAALRRPRPLLMAAALWCAGTAELTWARCRKGPRRLGERAAMAATSAVLPFAAVGWRAFGTVRALLERPVQPAVVLFDRDGTLVHDVPYNGDPDRVRLRPGAAAAVAAARSHGLAVGLITNQSGVGRGLIGAADVAAVNDRLAGLVGGFDVVLVCPHRSEDACACRKPAPGMVQQAVASLGTTVERCWVVGDIEADVAAAHSAGARAVLVPTAVTRVEEIRLAPLVAADLPTAVELIVTGGRRRT